MKITSLVSPQPESTDLVDELVRVAETGLQEMLDKRNQLFCYRRRQAEKGLKNEGSSRRYTIITLLGLWQLENNVRQSAIDTNAIQANLFEKEASTDAIDNIGDLGLLIWLLALSLPEKLPHFLKEVESKNPLSRYADAQHGLTTELAWFLAGLSHASLALGKGTNGADRLALATYEMLKRNYGGKGIFRHMSNSTLTGRIRGRIGSFADQVYPIYALTKFAQVYNSTQALNMAVECANTICHLQGSLGQWWWHYDAVTGRMIGRYPVYSVHQDGMAPMALFALNEVTGSDFRSNICKGLEWVTGQNELGINLIDESRKMIWRSLCQGKFKRYSEEALSLLKLNPNNGQTENPKVLHECRPYHLGWVLYALADKRSAVRADK
jgi:hypothetical protein